MRVRVYESPPVRLTLTWTHVPLFVQVRASTVVVVLVVLSLSVAVAQSYVTVSVHTTRYQNVRLCPVPTGAMKVCEMELSPLNGEALPTCAARVPVCDVVLIEVAPAPVHPV